MDCVTILAQAVESVLLAAAEAATEAEDKIVPITSIWEYVTSLKWGEAIIFISFGAVCLLYGWRVFKILVVISFGLIGLLLGMFVIDKIKGLDNQLVGGLIGMGLMAVLSVPLMRWAVSVLGAFAGGIVTSGIWIACGFTESYIWAGFLIGMIAGGMISFIVFKVAVILFSSLGGSALMVVGMLALLYTYPQTTAQVEQLVSQTKWFLPLALMAPTSVGLIIQHKFVKGSKEWDI